MSRQSALQTYTWHTPYLTSFYRGGVVRSEATATLGV